MIYLSFSLVGRLIRATDASRAFCRRMLVRQRLVLAGFVEALND